MKTETQHFHRLTLKRQAGGWRHFIGDDEIRCGDIIEVLQSDDWITGRYEANLHHTLPEPKAFLEIDERNLLSLETGAPVRWPTREAP